MINQTNLETQACLKCSYVAIHTKDLKRHETQMHDHNSFSEIYGCEKCGFSTQHEDNLKKHINDNHSHESKVRKI